MGTSGFGKDIPDAGTPGRSLREEPGAVVQMVGGAGGRGSGEKP